MPVVYCSISGCEDRTSSRHRFPKPATDLDRFNMWINVCGRKELLSLPPASVFANKRVCKQHFCKEDFGSNNRLLRSACPSLFIPGPAANKIQQCSDQTVLAEHSYALQPSESAVTVNSPIDISVLTVITKSPETQESMVTESVAEESTPAVPKTPTKSSQKLLSAINVTRQMDLTPKAKILYQQACYFKRRAASVVRRKLSFKQRLAAATKMSNDEAFLKTTSTMDKVRARFFKSQIECSGKKPRGCRFTLEDKILALSFYKQSGRGYKYLSKIFSLPSRATLLKLCNQIPVKPGFNQCIFHILKAEAANFKNPLDKYCILLFDEMSIAPNLSWNGSHYIVLGFEDFGYRRSEKIANHVQVFMLRGIKRKWKQPIFYAFVNSAAKPADIKNILSQLILKLKECGLYVLATTCDQGTNNSSAIKMLMQDTAAQYLRKGETAPPHIFEVGDLQVVPLYDPPHLLKGLRNNLLTKDLQLEINGEKLHVKWEHITNAFMIDSTHADLRVMPKITEYHVNPQKLKKMKVSCCSQVLSHSMASAINLMAHSGSSVTTIAGVVCMPREATQTATFLAFADKLFDSVNGTSFIDTVGKPLRTALSHNSPHLPFWVEALAILRSMKFICPVKKKSSIPPSITNWIFTINGFITLWSKMRGLGFKRLPPRYFNQDPLENFFGRIRQRGMRFTNPTPAAFAQNYKSLLMITVTSSHSVGANCEDDNSAMLISLQKFLTQDVQQYIENATGSLYLPAAFNPLRELEFAALQYVAGFVTHKLLPKFGKCATCRENVLISKSEDGSTHTLTSFREYGGSKLLRLKYCNDHFIETITIIYNILRTMLPVVIHQENFHIIIRNTLKKNVSFNFKMCEHNNNLCEFIITYFSKIMIHHTVNSVNNILCGKDDRIKETDSCLYKEVIEMRQRMSKKTKNN